MHVRGLMNMQYAIENGVVYVLEANPRASRTVPLVSKVCNIAMVPLATEIITDEFTGKESPLKGLRDHVIPHYGVKEAVFPFNMFPEVDPILGPEMRSTGEVLGISRSTGGAFYKAQEAAKMILPLEGTVLITLSAADRPYAPEIARRFHEAGFKILATGNTCKVISSAEIPVERVNKRSEGRPNILDLITNGQIQMIVNTPQGKGARNDDSYLRKAAIKAKIPYVTTAAAGLAAAEGISHLKRKGKGLILPLQEWHAMIRDKD